MTSQKSFAGSSAIAKTHELTNKIIQLIGQITQNYLAIGQALCTMRDGKFYRQLGAHVTSMDDFLTEIRLTRTTGYNLMAIYEKFGAYIETDMHIDYTRLVRALPVADSIGADKVVELLKDAELLPSAAYYDQIREMKNLPTTDNCGHEERIMLEKCTCCQKTWKM